MDSVGVVELGSEMFLSFELVGWGLMELVFFTLRLDLVRFGNGS